MSRAAISFARLALATALLLGCAVASAQGVARATFVSGALYLQTPKGEVRRLVEGAQLAVGDQVTTDAGAAARITFTDGAAFVLRENTRVVIEAYSYTEKQPEQDGLLLRLVKGGLRAVTGLVGKRGNADAYRVSTVAGQIGIRGTIFDALVCQQDCLGGADGLYTRAVQDPHTLNNDTGQTEVPEGASFYVRDRASRPVDISDFGGLGLSLPGAAEGRAPDRLPPARPECF